MMVCISSFGKYMGELNEKGPSSWCIIRNSIGKTY